MFTYKMHTSLMNQIANGLSDAQADAINKLTYNIDTDGDCLLINGNKYKVINDSKYAYCIQKTQIKAKNGANGLYQEFFKNSDSDALFNNHYGTVIENIIQKVKPVTK